VNDTPERRVNDALRRRIDTLLERVEAARAEMIERALDAVHPDRDQPPVVPDVDAEQATHGPTGDSGSRLRAHPGTGDSGAI
jgi:hypothetical protein